MRGHFLTFDFSMGILHASSARCLNDKHSSSIIETNQSVLTIYSVLSTGCPRLEDPCVLKYRIAYTCTPAFSSPVTTDFSQIVCAVLTMVGVLRTVWMDREALLSATARRGTVWGLIS